MRAQAPPILPRCTSMLVAIVALELHAQTIRLPQEPPQRMVVAPAATAPQSPGTGPLSASLDLAGTVVPLGNGAVVQFSDPSVPTGGSGGAPPSGLTTTPGRATVTFSSDDQLVRNALRAESCHSPLLTLMCQLTLTVTGTGGRRTATYVMRGVNIPSASLTSPWVITFAYKLIQYTFPAPPPSASQP